VVTHIRAGIAGDGTSLPTPIDPDHGLVRRRRLLGWLMAGAAAAFAGAFALPALALKSLAVPKAGVESGDILVVAGAMPGLAAGQPLRPADLPVGGAVQAFPSGKSDNQNALIQVVRIGDDPLAGGLVAFSAICTHLGCAVVPQLTPEGQIACPCHGSRFDPRRGGAVVKGPADRPLPGLPIGVSADGTLVAGGDFDAPVGPH
jgi:ubiquinol-cytochrome c reductase iron-sulfur subunit